MSNQSETSEENFDISNEFDYILDKFPILKTKINIWIESQIRNTPVLAFGQNINLVKEQVLERIQNWGKFFGTDKLVFDSINSTDPSKSIPLKDSEKLSFILIGNLIYKEEKKKYSQNDSGKIPKMVIKFKDVTGISKLIFKEILKFTTCTKELEFLPLLNIKLPECNKEKAGYCMDCQELLITDSLSEKEKKEILFKQDNKCFFNMLEITDIENKIFKLQSFLWWCKKNLLSGEGELCLINCNINCITSYGNGGKLSVKVGSLILIPYKYVHSSCTFEKEKYDEYRNQIIQEAIKMRKLNDNQEYTIDKTKKQKQNEEYVFDRQEF